MPLDYDLSPYTGWTRAHWERLAENLLATARRYGTANHAQVRFPGAPGSYGRAVDGLEGFARTFLAAGFLAAGRGGADPHGSLAWYADGFATGPDPESAGRWVRPSEHPQAKVEAASLALILHLTRPYFFDALPERSRQLTLDYLAEWVGAPYPPNNWVWFRLITEQFLKNAGGRYSEADIEHDLEFHESLYAGGGWYRDGRERSFDHYVGWALHLYPLLWCDMAAGDNRAERLRPLYTQRLNAYLADAIRLVGADGGPLVQGRSLIYRFAAAAPLWMGALAGSSGLTSILTPGVSPRVTPGVIPTHTPSAIPNAISSVTPSVRPSLTPGQVRRACSGMVRHFVDRGAPDAHGVLTMGWFDECRPMAQSYSGTGSPYWASKGLLGLALPADHPVWTAVEEPLPVERGDYATTIAAPGWIVCGTQRDGVVRVLNHGTDHAAPGDLRSDAPLYARMGYSTATAPVVVGADGADIRNSPRVGEGVGAPSPVVGVDNTVALLDATGRPSARTGLTTLALGPLATEGGPSGSPGAGMAFSRSRVHWVTPKPESPDYGGPVPGPVELGPWLVAGSVVRGAWEVRLALVTAADDVVSTADPSPLRASRRGTTEAAATEATTSEPSAPMAVATEASAARAAEPAVPSSGVLWVAGWPLPHVGEGESLDSAVSNGRLRSEVRDAGGLPCGGVEWLARVSPIGTLTAVPWRSSDGPAVAGRWYAALVCLRGETRCETAAPRVGFDTYASAARLAITWGDGAVSDLDLGDVIERA